MHEVYSTRYTRLFAICSYAPLILTHLFFLFLCFLSLSPCSLFFLLWCVFLPMQLTTALILASTYGHIATVQVLIEAGADKEAKDGVRVKKT